MHKYHKTFYCHIIMLFSLIYNYIYFCCPFRNEEWRLFEGCVPKYGRHDGCGPVWETWLWGVQSSVGRHSALEGKM